MKGNKTYWSNWHITINCNKHERTVIERRLTARKLADAVRDAHSSPRYLWRWLKLYKNKRQVPFTSKEKHKVDRIRSRVSLEVGPSAENRSVHAHVLLEIEHRTRVQIDIPEFQAVLEELLGWTGLNLLSRFVRGNGEDKEYLLRYLQKDGVPHRVARNEDNRRLQNSEYMAEDESYPI